MAKIGFVFPGQGSQKQGMLADLAAENPGRVGYFYSRFRGVG